MQFGPSLVDLALVAGGFAAMTILAILNVMARDFEYNAKLAKLAADAHELRERQLERIRALGSGRGARSKQHQAEKLAA